MQRLELLRRIWRVDDVVLVTEDSQKVIDGTNNLGKSYLKLSLGNLLRAVLFGYNARLEVLPEGYVAKVLDFTYLPGEGSLGLNAPFLVEKYRGRKVELTERVPRFHNIFPA